MSFFKDTSPAEMESLLNQAWNAFTIYRNTSLQQRASFMRNIAQALSSQANDLIATADKETHLGLTRLGTEFNRTLFQLNNYADACERGNWLEASIDTANDKRNPPTPDIRKSMLPLGPVAVFGASNFPFAYSTAGGDTACAFAAGCPVVVKGHPAHAATSEKVAAIIRETARRSQLPEGVFAHVQGNGFETGAFLVKHPKIKAVGFTGSYQGGKALFDWANQRSSPIPVFAEMGSINPVFLLPIHLQEHASTTARAYAESITLSVGQFCTNPGLIIGIKSEPLDLFIQTLVGEIEKIAPGDMLHTGIAKAYAVNRANALMQKDVLTAGVSHLPASENQGIPTIAVTTATNFIQNKVLHQEVFGPYALIVQCQDMEQMQVVASHLEGQITSTLIATEQELLTNQSLVDTIRNNCGRIVVNGVPTGVSVCLSMQHGGPFPATTDARFTSVGAGGIKRFCRPVSYQNWPDAILPEELQDRNPLGIWRTVNDELSRLPVTR